MKQVADINELRQLALRKGAEITGDGIRFNSGRARLQPRPTPPPTPNPPPPPPTFDAQALASLVSQMAHAIAQAMKASSEVSPAKLTHEPAVKPPVVKPEPAKPQASKPAQILPQVTSGSLALTTVASGAISGGTIDLPNGGTLKMKVQHKFGLMEGVTVDVGDSRMRFTVHRNPKTLRADTISFTSGEKRAT